MLCFYSLVCTVLDQRVCSVTLPQGLDSEHVATLIDHAMAFLEVCIRNGVIQQNARLIDP